MKNYRYLTIITVLYVTFQLVSDVTAGKIISIGFLTISVTALYFPITYILSDVLTEVYGYGQARKVVWLTLLASVVAGLTYQVSLLFPAEFGPNIDDAYNLVLGSVPRVLLGGWIAVWLGALVNDYILAKMKVLTSGRYLAMRTITSTIFGEGVNTLIFYVVALGGVLPANILLSSIFSAWLIKVMVEVVLTPITYVVVAKLKIIENEDYYDYKTNYNPFKA